MACIIHTNLCSDNILKKLRNDLTINIEPKNKRYGNGKISTIRVYNVNEEGKNRPANIPFNYSLSIDGSFRPERIELPEMSHQFVGDLRKEQKKCRNDALYLLQKSKTLMLACYTGFGKTVTSINMASKLKLKTLISVPKSPLLGQWESEIQKFIPDAVIHVLTPKEIKKVNFDERPDFCIVYGLNIHKIQPAYLASFGFVVVDEAHLQMTEVFMSNLLFLTPRYLLGVTATPYRDDGYNVLFKLFFGQKMVEYPLYKKHIVYKVKTNFVPNEKKYMTYTNTYNVKVDWNQILNEQSENVERNNLIIDIVTKFKDRTFLILVKRVEQGRYLVGRLASVKEKVTSLLGKDQDYDKSARILVGTSSKIGTGFDHPKLDTLIVGGDMVSYYIQFLGRIMRRKDVDPIVFDLVDSHHILLKHFKERSKVYNKHGGEIMLYC